MLDEKVKNKIYLVANENDEPTFRIVSTNTANDELMIKDISLTTGFGLFKANEFMRNLNTGIDIKFDNFKQYYELVNNVNHFIIERGVKVNA